MHRYLINENLLQFFFFFFDNANALMRSMLVLSTHPNFHYILFFFFLYVQTTWVQSKMVDSQPAFTATLSHNLATTP